MTGTAAEKEVRASGNRMPEVERIIDRVREQMGPCIQCGTCSASCPNLEFMDLTPRQMWRTVLSGRTEDLFDSLSFAMCSACYWCTLRCPRGLPLTRAMAELKQAGALMALSKTRRADLFYRLFLDNVRQYGRVREMELMGRYFWGLKNPVTPIAYAPLGLALLRRKKIHPALPSRGPGKLDHLFEKAAGGGR